MRERESVGDVIGRLVVARHRRRGRPGEVLVQHTPELTVSGQAYVIHRPVEASDGALVHLLVRTVATVHPYDRRLVAVALREGGGTAERLRLVGRQSFRVLRVEPVAEGVAHDLIGHYALVHASASRYSPSDPPATSYTLDMDAS